MTESQDGRPNKLPDQDVGVTVSCDQSDAAIVASGGGIGQTRASECRGRQSLGVGGLVAQSVDLQGCRARLLAGQGSWRRMREVGERLMSGRYRMTA